MVEPAALSPLELAKAALAAIRSYFWLVLLGLLVVPTAAYVLNNTGNRYEASAELALVPSTGSAALAQLGIPGLAAPTVNQLTADAVLDDLSSRVRFQTTRASLRSRLEADQPEGSDQATLTARASSARKATSLANTWATSLVVSRNAELARQFVSARRVLRSQLAQSENPEDARAALAGLTQLETLRGALPSDIRVVQGAARGKLANRHSLGVAALLGLLAGIAAALATALLITRRLLTPAVAAANFGAPLLGVISPLSRGRRRHRKARGSSEVLSPEALNSAVLLQSRLALSAPQTATLLIAPPRHHRFRSQIALHVAAAYADAALSVVLVRWRADGPRQSDPTRMPENLEIVEEAGRWAVLESRLRDLEERYERLVIDGPGILDSGDALLATQRLPVWVLSVGVGDTRSDEADDLRREVAGLDKQPVGLAVGVAERRRWLRKPRRRQ